MAKLIYVLAERTKEQKTYMEMVNLPVRRCHGRNCYGHQELGKLLAKEKASLKTANEQIQI